jgi:hypothetical protein
MAPCPRSCVSRTQEFDLGAYVNKKAGTLSGGNKRKVRRRKWIELDAISSASRAPFLATQGNPSGAASLARSPRAHPYYFSHPCPPQLCVAIASIGGSPLLFLDEPCVGICERSACQGAGTHRGKKKGLERVGHRGRWLRTHLLVSAHQRCIIPTLPASPTSSFPSHLFFDVQHDGRGPYRPPQDLGHPRPHDG